MSVPEAEQLAWTGIFDKENMVYQTRPRALQYACITCVKETEEACFVNSVLIHFTVPLVQYFHVCVVTEIRPVLKVSNGAMNELEPSTEKSSLQPSSPLAKRCQF